MTEKNTNKNDLEKLKKTVEPIVQPWNNSHISIIFSSHKKVYRALVMTEWNPYHKTDILTNSWHTFGDGYVARCSGSTWCEIDFILLNKSLHNVTKLPSPFNVDVSAVPQEGLALACTEAGLQILMIVSSLGVPLNDQYERLDMISSGKIMSYTGRPLVRAIAFELLVTIVEKKEQKTDLFGHTSPIYFPMWVSSVIHLILISQNEFT